LARTARVKSESGIYHVIVSGINRQNIFLDEEDKSIYFDRLTQYKNECNVKVYAYCLMSNHVHLLLSETDKPLNEFMKKLGTSYSYRFNQKYDRIGHLFQDRFKSEPVDDDSYFLTVFRYIHQNPEKAGLTPFSLTSYQDYAQRRGITDTGFALSLFGSTEELLNFLKEDTNEGCMEYEEENRITDKRAADMICRIAKVEHGHQLQNIEENERNRIIKELKDAGISIRQIERLTGMNRGIVFRA
jgi:REP element-mobilizing transposase RayT